ncbi:serine hydrolase [Pseudoruegeria sp. SK021]|nr:serine hydrolase [Pseudoruegeria sp. SK021]
MTASGVPGVAVAVVHEGDTIFSKGYGVRELGHPGAVTPDTVFQIASLSKSVAATVVAGQIAETEVDWTTPVQSLLPWFDLSDTWVSSHVTIGDLFSHRSGLPEKAGDVLEDLGFDRREVLSRLDLLPLLPFRISYGYSNFGLTAAAEAVAVAAGTDWASLSEATLYAPLGMTRTSSRFDDFVAHEERAIGHTLVNEVFTPYRSRQPDAQSPAGGMSSTVTDFAKWMIMVLEGGDAPLVAASNLLPAVTPQVISRRSATAATLPEFYGFGFGVGPDATGRVRLSHSGAFVLGAATRYVMIPEAGLGIVVFTNGTPVGAPEAIAQTFVDVAEFGAAQRDWWGLFSEGFRPFRAPVGELAGQVPPTDPAPAGPLDSYAGTYDHAFFGPATITATDGSLTLSLGPNGLSFPLTHWSGDRFVYDVLNENMPAGSVAEVTFDAAVNGASPALRIDYLAADDWGTFRR